MQDKEFDELFRSRLDDLELTPSAGVWDNIAVELGAGKRKNLLAPFLSIAACVIVLVAAGILFIPQKTTVVTKHPVKENIAKTKSPVTTVIAAAKHDQDNLNPTVPVAKQSVASVSAIAKLPHEKTDKNESVNNTAPVIEQAKPVKQDEQVLMASAQPKKEIITAVVPDDGTPLIAKQPVIENMALNKPELAAVQLPVNKPDAAPAKAKRRGHTLGDFINVIVARVDKRADKVIEFTDTDDDESTITALNIGFLKIKKEK